MKNPAKSSKEYHYATLSQKKKADPYETLNKFIASKVEERKALKNGGHRTTLDVSVISGNNLVVSSDIMSRIKSPKERPKTRDPFNDSGRKPILRS